MKWLPAFTGICAAFAGLLVVVAPHPMVVESAPLPLAPEPTVVFAPEPVAATVTGTPELLPGLQPEVGAVLGQSGYASFATDAELSGVLTPEIVQTLVSHGAILVVPEPSSSGAAATTGGTP
jgi:hypothetical protein